MPKKEMLMIASHEPLLDPRVDWVAQTANSLLRVTVLGFESVARPEPPYALVNGYAVMRISDKRFRPIFMFLFGARLFFRPTSEQPIRAAGELALKSLAAFLLMVPMSIAALAFVAYWLLGYFSPLRWARFGCRKTMSSEQYVRTRDAWRAWAVDVQKRYWRPTAKSLARRFPRVASLAKRFLHFANRVREFQWYIGHVLKTTSSLIDVATQSRPPAIIYCNDLDTLLAGVLLKKHFACALVYDAHEFWACMNAEFYWWERIFWLQFERTLAPHTDAAYTVNHLLAAEMQRMIGVPYGALPNCEPIRDKQPEFTPRFLDAAPTVLSVANVGVPTRMRFLFQGVFSPGRGIEELIRAWAPVDHSRAVLLLRGPDGEFKDRCIALADDLQLLGAAIEFLAPVRESELVGAAGEADVGVIPYAPYCMNSRLACPNKTSQYMQAGLAILTNNLDYVREIVEEFECGLIYDSDRPETVVAAINRFLNEPELLDQFSKNAQAKAREVFNWNVQSLPLVRMFEELTDQGEVKSNRSAA